MSKQDLMYDLVAEQEHSGLTITTFCVAKDIRLNTFHYWKRKYKEENSSGTGFIAIAALSKAGSQPIRLTYPNGVNIHLAAADLSLIAQLIRIG